MKSLLLLLVAETLTAANTTVLFQPGSPAVGPYPNNALTVPDSTQKTGLRINLPLPPACGTPALSACTNTALLNQLDGFSVNPRINVCFSGPIDVGTLDGAIQIIPAKAATTPIKINQVIYDPAGNCAYAKPDQVLPQDSSYLLVVNDSLNDANGKKLKADKGFSDCLKEKSGGAYCVALSATLESVLGKDGDKLLAASLFTTMSATDWSEKARAIAAGGPPIILAAGPVSIFPLTTVKSITYVPQDNPALDVPVSALSGVETVAFGLYLSPNFTNVSGPQAGSISVTPTNGPIAGPIPIPGLPNLIPEGYVPISFHVFLPPLGQKPAKGFPVAIYGHGLGDTQFGASTYIASTLAKQGIATLAFEIPGHGFGPQSYVNVVGQNGSNYRVSTPGRGVQLSPGAPYGATDGCILPGALAVRDCGRQAAVDLSALVHTIQATAGLVSVLDPAQIFYIGQSFGGTYGTVFHAVEPAVARAVLNVTGGTSVDVSRLAISGRPLAAFYLGTNNPPLLNVPPAPSETYFHDSFNDNYVFRDLPPVVNNVPGALPIQAAFEVADWLGMLGDPLAFAPHLKVSPLQGVPTKATLFQFGLGDLEIPNPTESAVVRAADGLSSTWFFRFDQAVQTHPELLGVTQPGSALPILPHRYLSNPTIFAVPAETSIALATQMQAAKFLQGAASPDPNPFLTSPFIGMHLFEIPATLPERLNFLQIQP